jgi:signal recognition particle subunit SRP54
MGKITNQQLDDAEKKNKQYRAMIMSMKPVERKNPDLLASQPHRRTRIAKGSGHTEAEVSTLVAQFAAMRKQVPPAPRIPPLLTHACKAGCPYSKC